jgi:hypothetical protein
LLVHVLPSAEMNTCPWSPPARKLPPPNVAAPIPKLEVGSEVVVKAKSFFASSGMPRSAVELSPTTTTVAS